MSSLAEFSNQVTGNNNHGGIISTSEAIENIFEQLGLDRTKVVATISADIRQEVFVASLRSPGTLHVCNSGDVCDSNLGIALSDQKLFFLPGYGHEDLEVSIDADGSTGGYRLHLGDLSDGVADWIEALGNLVQNDQTDSYDYHVRDGQPEVGVDGQTTRRSFDEAVARLTNLIPRWDKNNLVRRIKAESAGTNSRVVAIRQLRELLSKTAIKSYKNNRADQIEAIIDVWESVDEIAEIIIGNSNKVKAGFLSANILQVEGYKILADRLLGDSSSYYAGIFYSLFADRFAEAKGMVEPKKDLSLDKTLSARYLLLTALGVR
jgi:hypothetical protein